VKNLKQRYIHYVINLIIAVFLSFSLVYTLTIYLDMTYEAKDIFMFVVLSLVLYSIVFANTLSVKVTSMVSVLAVVVGLFYYFKKPLVSERIYNKIVSVFIWFVEYIYDEVPLNIEYQKYIVLVISMFISLLVYRFAVKKFNFYLLLMGGTSLFVTQWILGSFESYVSFYIFVFFILVCYFKHIYLKNKEAGQGPTYEYIGFLLFSIPICGIVFILAYLMPASEQPIEWNWIDRRIESAQSYVKTRLNEDGTGNGEYSGASTSGFAEEISILEGSVTLDDTLVMKVDTSERGIYLKGAVRDVYTGMAWRSLNPKLTSLGQKYQVDNHYNDIYELLVGSRIISNDINILDEIYTTTSAHITYENLKTSTLFIPSKTEKVIFNTELLNIYRNDYGILSSETLLDKDFQYTIELYSIKNNNEVGQLLRNSSRGFYNRYLEKISNLRTNEVFRRDISRLAKVSEDIYNRYLQLPSELPDRVQALSLEITSSAENDYDRVRAIEAYLSNNYSYTLDPGSLPKDRDFVDYFLFDLKQGYCSYYASAMTVLVRSIGIPARYVEGYILPSEPIRGTTYEITNQQAHAWVEVYFEGFGWFPFEPTSPFSQDLYNTLEETSTDEVGSLDQTNVEENMLEDEVVESQETKDIIDNEPINHMEEDSALKYSIMQYVLLMSLFFFVWVITFPILRRKFIHYKIKRLTPAQGIIELYKYYLKALSVQGIQIEPGETPLQFAQRIDEVLTFKTTNFQAVTEAFIKARYGNDPMDKGELQLVLDFYSTFSMDCKEKIGWPKYFIYNNLLGWI
jgi:hypothetical protein